MQFVYPNTWVKTKIFMVTYNVPKSCENIHYILNLISLEHYDIGGLQWATSSSIHTFV